MNYLSYEKISLKLCFYLILSLPIALIFSKFALNTIVGLTSIIILSYIIICNKFYDLRYIPSYLFITFCLYISVRSTFTNYLELSLKSSLLYIRFLFFIYAFYYLNLYYNDFIKKFFYVFLASLIILIIDSYIQFFFTKNLFGYSTAVLENNRISSFFKDELILGGFIIRSCYLLIGLAIFTNFKYKKIIILLLILSSTHIAFISGERTSFFLSILGIILFFIMSDIFNLKQKTLLFVSLIIIVLITVFSFDGIKKRMYTQTVSDLDTAKNIFMFSGGHEAHYLTALKLYEDNKLFGKGSNLFRVLCHKKEYIINKKSCSTHPHNFYFQMLGENGLIGFAFLLLFYLTLIYLATKHCVYKYFLGKNYLEEYEVAILISLLISFWPIAPNGNFFNSWLSTIYFIQISFMHIFLRKRIL